MTYCGERGALVEEQKVASGSACDAPRRRVVPHRTRSGSVTSRSVRSSATAGGSTRAASACR